MKVLIDDREVFLDEQDAHWLAGFKWRVKTAPNRKRGTYYLYLASRHCYFHKLIMTPPEGMEVDHINGNGLDNRRSNLRAATHQQNMQNLRHARAGSGFKGVHFHSVRYGKYAVKIALTGDCRARHLGFFDNPEDAARVYDAAARECFGEFACTNEDLGLLPRATPLVAARFRELARRALEERFKLINYLRALFQQQIEGPMNTRDVFRLLKDSGVWDGGDVRFPVGVVSGTLQKLAKRGEIAKVGLATYARSGGAA